MGMDVYGQNPDSEVGEYFRNNVWWWRPLWNFCEQVGSEVIPANNLGHSNDGWGLDENDSKRLAEILTDEIDSGRCAAFATEYEHMQNSIPDVPCEICGSTGLRNDRIGQELREKNPEYTCNGCNGKGKREPTEKWYPFSVENVVEFRDFLIHCGGFEIC